MYLFKVSFLSYADEWTSQDTFLASNNGKLIITLWSGDTGLRETTTKSISVGLRPILISCYEFRRVNIAVFIVRILHKVKCGSGDTLPLVRRYKGPTDIQWFNLSTNFNEHT
ncbi:hypothetical protein V1477_007007 [Vespula maculifrons]|uniref:Uncharacterized protein n=1 Tax=Vespula maculifrons TaxID=7453 RepID=A0ABD2CHC8_VESMC